mmetsp:Transcript_126092/g.364883  ORF Transcript_126092/g.364883 Transcript_126092/m.364883 type:complete len:226 (+) Transcript_126092:879-1556(+)
MRRVVESEVFLVAPLPSGDHLVHRGGAVGQLLQQPQGREHREAYGSQWLLCDRPQLENIELAPLNHAGANRQCLRPHSCGNLAFVQQLLPNLLQSVARHRCCGSSGCRRFAIAARGGAFHGGHGRGGGFFQRVPADCRRHATRTPRLQRLAHAPDLSQPLRVANGAHVQSQSGTVDIRVLVKRHDHFSAAHMQDVDLEVNDIAPPDQARAQDLRLREATTVEGKT